MRSSRESTTTAHQFSHHLALMFWKMAWSLAFA
jgi:hypothetical protein